MDAKRCNNSELAYLLTENQYNKQLCFILIVVKYFKVLMTVKIYHFDDAILEHA